MNTTICSTCDCIAYLQDNGTYHCGSDFCRITEAPTDEEKLMDDYESYLDDAMHAHYCRPIDIPAMQSGVEGLIILNQAPQVDDYILLDGEEFPITSVEVTLERKTGKLYVVLPNLTIQKFDYAIAWEQLA
jgi:hypothetical protein